MKKLIHVGLWALAMVSVACGVPLETDTQGQDEGQVSASSTPCRETNVCEQCSQGGRNKRTYYSRQEFGGGVWVCSGLTTEYGPCGSCAF